MLEDLGHASGRSRWLLQHSDAPSGARIGPSIQYDGPMGETANIAEMAKRVSDDIFEIFGWERRGPLDENFECCKDHRAKATDDETTTTAGKKIKTHPSDIVFRYDDPYTNAASYLTTDLKSYGEESITKTTLGKPLKSMCQAIDCANVSEDFQQRYISGEDRWHVHGLLFVYNHDGFFRPEEFTKLVANATPANLRAPRDRRVFVLGPGDIAHLHSVARDLMVYRGNHLNRGATYRWFTPDLIIRKSRTTSFGKAAPIETLLGPWQIAGIVHADQPQPSRLRLYYRCRGTPNVEEFEYLIEFLFRHRLLDYPIDLCLVGSEGPTLERFQAAVNNVIETLYGLDEFRARLSKIEPQVLSEFQTRFSSANIGMERA